MPAECHRRGLEQDYMAMRSMIFGPVSSFAEVLESLDRLEGAINGHG